ncbi:MAG: M1 family aminopeptidase [bacterium]
MLSAPPDSNATHALAVTRPQSMLDCVRPSQLSARLTKYLFPIFALLLLSVTSSSGARRERLIEDWRPLHYSISLTMIDGLSGITEGRADVSVLVLRSHLTVIDFDFGDLAVDGVSIADAPAQFTRTPGKLNVILSSPPASGSRITVSVKYHGRPSDGLILKPDKDGKASAVGDNWPDRVHQWIPCLDYPAAKASVSFTVTVPKQNLVVANGRLVRVQDSGESRTWSYDERAAIPPYCMIIAVGQFTKQDLGASSTVSLSSYVPNSDQRYAMQGFAPADLSLKFFSQTVAPYPYEKLALIVGATQFGGMENSSAIVFNRGLFDYRLGASTSPRFHIRRGLVEIVAHEIAHQWFGDSVTEATWSDLWLSEGFATYFAGVFVQRYEGEPAFRNYMKDAADKYFEYERKTKTPIFDTETEDLFKLLNPNNYEKGAWVLHMLRSELGDKDFFAGIRDYYAEHKDANATSEDLRLALEHASGKDLRSFFSSWIYGPGHPRYELSWQWNEQTKVLRLSLKQTQTEGAFPNRVPVEIATDGEKQLLTLRPLGRDTVEEVRLKSTPRMIVLDPVGSVLKEAKVKRLR